MLGLKRGLTQGMNTLEKCSRKINSVELFVGAGGMALGGARAGFCHLAVLDSNKNVCETLRQNKINNIPYVVDWDVIECDVRTYDFSRFSNNTEVVFGGPPCQPFSIAGKHLGYKDNRNMFPYIVRAIEVIRPKAFVFENVRGIYRIGFQNHFNYIIHQLRLPSITRKKGENWQDHLTRLEKIHTNGKNPNPSYNVICECMEAADFGVPQRRTRVFIVGVRSDLGIAFGFPHRSHCHDALLYDKWVSGEYWDRHRISISKRPKKPIKQRCRIDELSTHKRSELGAAWRTVRDAIHDLPPLGFDKTYNRIANHYLNPGARSYLGHNGSSYDDPAKTVKAGIHGVPGGENSLRLDDGTLRYFSVRECARLQCFPDDWVFMGSWTAIMHQLGNAVPVDLAEAIAKQVAETIGAAQ